MVTHEYRDALAKGREFCLEKHRFGTGETFKYTPNFSAFWKKGESKLGRSIANHSWHAH